MDTHGILSVRDFFGDGNIIFYGILTFENLPAAPRRLKQNFIFCIKIVNPQPPPLSARATAKLPNYGICLSLSPPSLHSFSR